MLQTHTAESLFHGVLWVQEVTMKMSQEDLASLKDAIRKQKGGGGADDSSFVEV